MLADRSDPSGLGRENGKDETHEALWVVALRSWAAAKTSGLGYSLYYSGNRLGGAAYVNFMPFFLPSLSLNRFTSAESSDAEEPGAKILVADSNAQQPPPARGFRAQDVVDPRVAVGGNHPRSVELNETDARQNEDDGKHGDALQACSA